MGRGGREETRTEKNLRSLEIIKGGMVNQEKEESESNRRLAKQPGTGWFKEEKVLGDGGNIRMRVTGR